MNSEEIMDKRQRLQECQQRVRKELVQTIWNLCDASTGEVKCAGMCFPEAEESDLGGYEPYETRYNRVYIDSDRQLKVDVVDTLAEGKKREYTVPIDFLPLSRIAVVASMTDVEVALLIARDLKALWPKGSMVVYGKKYPWQDSEKETAERLLALKRKYGVKLCRRSFTDAAMRYLQDNGGLPKHLLRYFVFKDKRGVTGIEYQSPLLDYIDIVESENSEIQ